MRRGPLSASAKAKKKQNFKNGASARLTRETIVKYNDPSKNFCGIDNLSLGVVKFVQ